MYRQGDKQGLNPWDSVKGVDDYKLNSKIGTIIGQYKILNKCNIKSSDGHSLYDAQCIKCGYIRHNKRLNELEDINIGCNHYNLVKNWHNFRLRDIFNSMKERCYNKNNSVFKFYGFRGITICKEWLDDPQKFNDWSLANGYNDNLTIDRINENKNYCPENCRWVTKQENSKWKSTTRRITVNSITDSGRGWSKRLGLNINYINKYIIKNGMEKCKLFIENSLAKD